MEIALANLTAFLAPQILVQYQNIKTRVTLKLHRLQLEIEMRGGGPSKVYQPSHEGGGGGHLQNNNTPPHYAEGTSTWYKMILRGFPDPSNQHVSPGHWKSSCATPGTMK